MTRDEVGAYKPYLWEQNVFEKGNETWQILTRRKSAWCRHCTKQKKKNKTNRKNTTNKQEENKKSPLEDVKKWEILWDWRDFSLSTQFLGFVCPKRFVDLKKLDIETLPMNSDGNLSSVNLLRAWLCSRAIKSSSVDNWRGRVFNSLDSFCSTALLRSNATVFGIDWHASRGNKRLFLLCYFFWRFFLLDTPPINPLNSYDIKDKLAERCNIHFTRHRFLVYRDDR